MSVTATTCVFRISSSGPCDTHQGALSRHQQAQSGLPAEPLDWVKEAKEAKVRNKLTFVTDTCNLLVAWTCQPASKHDAEAPAAVKVHSEPSL
eukprot:2775803-Amphidinium_carterae.1